MVERTGTETGDLGAGPLSAWLGGMQRALRGESASDVPCDGCTACCTASQFVPIGPDETATLAHIPRELLFPAPRLPAGHLVLGYDERGRCPMLTDEGCSIYEHRPRTCRTYDCRIFAATGVEPDDAQGLVAARARRWRFELRTDADRAASAALRAAARHVREHPDAVRDGTTSSPTAVAVAAVEVHEVFFRRER